MDLQLTELPVSVAVIEPSIYKQEIARLEIRRCEDDPDNIEITLHVNEGAGDDLHRTRTLVSYA